MRTLYSPYGLAAMALLAANDLVLKQLWPGWITGKLSDLAAIFLWAALVGSGLSWLFPGLAKRPRWLGWIACSTVGLAFAWIKTNPEAGIWITSFVPVRMVTDPSDIIALVGLIPAGWLLGRNESAPVFRPAHAEPKQKNGKRAGMIALALAAAFVLADAAAPDMGIHCLSANQAELVAEGGYGSQFTSRDGGLTWQGVTTGPSFGPENCASQVNGATTVAQPDSPIVYRITPDKGIERSEDSGSTWKSEYPLRPFNQRELAYIEKTRSGSLVFPARPLAAQIDPGSGNLVLAMGYEGALVRKTDGAWTAVAIGGYRPRSLETDGLSGILTLLIGEILLAGITALLVFSVLCVRARPRKFDWIRLVLGILAWAGLGFLFPPALTNGAYVAGIVITGLLIAGVWALAWAIVDAIRLRQRALRPAGWALLTGILFFLPYLVWGIGLLPEYYTAAGLAFGLALVLAFLAGQIKAVNLRQ